jgi:hypothetical protein
MQIRFLLFSLAREIAASLSRIIRKQFGLGDKDGA